MMSWFCLTEYMQQILRAQRVADGLVARAGAQDVGDVVGHLAVAGAHHGVVGPGGRQQAVHLHAGDDVLVAAVAVLRLGVGREELEAGGEDDGADLGLDLLALHVEVDAVGRADVDAVLALRADAAVEAAAGAEERLVLGQRSPRLARIARRRRSSTALGLERLAAVVDVLPRRGPRPCPRPAARSSKAPASSSTPCSQRSIMKAARRPWPAAVVIIVGPVTTSPAAKTCGTAVCSVSGSAWIVPVAVDLEAERPVSAPMPAATITRSQSMLSRWLSSYSGRKRPSRRTRRCRP